MSGGPASATGELAGESSSQRRLKFWGGLLVGAAAGVLATLIVLGRLQGDATPELTPALFHAAYERWRSAPLENYDLEVRVTGPQPATYRVRVRNGEAQAATRNGQPLTQQRVFGTWSVEGMFGTIARDVEQVEERLAGKAGPHAPRLSLRAKFDPQHGFPAIYRRIEWGGAGEVRWEVVALREGQMTKEK